MPRAFFARSPDGSTFLVRYYLLGDDTAMHFFSCYFFAVMYCSISVPVSSLYAILVSLL